MTIEHNENSIIIVFSSPKRVLSSALYGGGLSLTTTIANIHTNSDALLNTTPQRLISDFLQSKALCRNAVCLLTGADLKYAQCAYTHKNGLKVCAVVTAGVSNALNITERHQTSYTGEIRYQTGTINTIILTNALLIDECLVSSIITATEAKTAALLDLRVKCVVGGKQSTGTGTDSIAVVSGNRSTVQYAGGHTLFGQLVARATYSAVKKSIRKKVSSFDKIHRFCQEIEH
jgi:iron complex transport system ATP-binding protein